MFSKRVKIALFILAIAIAAWFEFTPFTVYYYGVRREYGWEGERKFVVVKVLHGRSKMAVSNKIFAEYEIHNMVQQNINNTNFYELYYNVQLSDYAGNLIQITPSSKTINDVQNFIKANKK